MLDLIASELWYVSLIRLVDVETLAPYWGATASLTRVRELTVTGSTPDATLAVLAIQAISTQSFMPANSGAILEPIAEEMLRLLLIRPRAESASSKLWTATAWMRGGVTVSAVGEMPNVALRNLVALLTTQ